MKHSSKRTGSAAVFAPVLAAWIFLGLVGSTAAQVADDEMARQYAEQSLRVSVWLNKDEDQVFRRGEPVEVTFQTNEDAYAVVYHVDVAGRVSILWPTSRFSDGFVFGGHQYGLPSREGNRMRVGDAEGLGYVQAIVPRYPFDLREVALDFHHENGGHAYDYYVAGDPFLAMNEVNYAVTGLEDASGYVVTNYVNYYVHRKVDYPRYLCFQCHEDEPYAPYGDTCSVNIRYDHGWLNEWWITYGFYPAYYYPSFYYVDPWTSARWVNYWYDPWYRWPTVVVYDWGHRCYDWRYSPYWSRDAWTVHEQGGRRYTPLDRTALGRDRDGVRVRTKNQLVSAEKPGDDRLRRMRDQVATDGRSDRRDDPRLRDGGPAGGTTRDVSANPRSQVRYEPDQRIRTSPGLRLPDRTATNRNRKVDNDWSVDAPGNRRGRTGETVGDRVRENRKPTGRTSTVRPGDSGDTGGRQTIRPVEPRRDSGRVWTNRRQPSSGNVRPQVPATRPSKPSSNRTTNVRRPSKQPSAPAAPRGGSTRVSRPPKQSAPKPAAPPPSRPSRGGGKTGGSRGSKSSGGRG